MADWNKIKTEYLTTDTSYRKLAEKHGVNATTIAKKASKEDWQSQRQQQANETLSKMLAADTKQKVDRVARLMTVADKLLEKVEQCMDTDLAMTAAALKNLSDAIRNIKDTQMIRTAEDIEEQNARIAKLRKEAEQEDQANKEIKVTMDGGIEVYSK